MTVTPSSSDFALHVLERISDGYLALDRNWRYTYLNPVALRVLGRAAGDLLGRVIWDEYPDTVEQFGVHYRRAMEEQVEVEFEEFYAPLDLWTHLRIVPTGTGLGVFFRDITTRKRAAQYQDRLNTLNALLNASAFPEEVARAALTFARSESGQYGGLIALASPDGSRLHVTHHTGYDAAALAGWMEFSTSLDVPLAQTQRTGEALYLTGAALTGTFADLQANLGNQSLVCLPLPAGDGQPMGVLAFSFGHPRRFDELDRGFFSTMAAQCAHAFHRAQLYAQAQRNELRYRLLAEATSSLTWTAEADMRITEPQPTWRAFTGQSDAETLGHGWLAAVHPDDRVSVQDQVRAGEAGGTRFRIEGRVRRADGEYRRVVSDAVPVRNARGGREGLIGVVQDVTEQHLREQHEAARRRIVDDLSQRNNPDALCRTVAAEVADLTGADQVRLVLWPVGEGRPRILASHSTHEVNAPLQLEDSGWRTLMRMPPPVHLAEADAGSGRQRAYLWPLPMPEPLQVALIVEFRHPVVIPAPAASLLDLVSGALAAAVQRALLLQDLADRELTSRSMIEALHEGVVLVEEGGASQAVNSSAQQLLGLPPGQGEHSVHDISWSLIRPDGRLLEVHEYPGMRALRGERVRNEVLGYVRRDGTPTWWSLNAAPLPRLLGQERAQAVLTVQDVAAQVTLREQLERQAAHDDLTGLPNRRTFTARLGLALKAAQVDQRAVAVILVDVDQFKDVNDTLGHPVGDEVLIVLAGRLQGLMAARGLVARLSGDEFGILLPVRDAEEAGLAAQAIRQHLGGPLTAGGFEVPLTVSVGVALAPADGQTERELLRNAGLAMYHAKGTGRNAVGVYNESLAQARRRRRALAVQLRQDLHLGALHLACQPIVDLCTGDVISVEALARWTSPTLGTVRPDEFIPVAEETGLIRPLTAWVLEAAARQGAAWHALGRRDLRVSVNVSPVQFLDPDLPLLVQGVLARTGLPPSGLQLEVTESAVMRDVECARAQCETLRSMGVHLALDDFGTGHSSLATLHALPFHVLKLDRAFVWGAEGDDRRVAMIRSILTLAGALDLAVVAEGIETPAQREMLSRLGCTLGQGYLFSRPLPPEELTTRLKQGSRVTDADDLDS